MQPLLSIIVPVYNCSEYIKESVFTLLDQLPSDYEAIIVDDGSEDQSNEIVWNYCKNIENVRLLFAIIRERQEQGMPDWILQKVNI